MMKKQAQGFTLVELMMVVAIIATLAMLALPSYQRYIEEGDLKHAHSELVKINQEIKIERLKNPSEYRTQKDLDDLLQGGAASSSSSPRAAATASSKTISIDQAVLDKYRIGGAIVSEDSTAYRLYAVPNGAYKDRYTKAIWMDSWGNAYKCANATEAEVFSPKCEKIGSITKK